MVTKEEYKAACAAKDEAQAVINDYHREARRNFEQRMIENPIFTDDELRYSARSLCICGHGLAYPKTCGPGHYWECSAILKGIADKEVEHSEQFPFAFYSIKSESEHNGTTRGTFKPQEKSDA